MSVETIGVVLKFNCSLPKASFREILVVAFSEFSFAF